MLHEKNFNRGWKVEMREDGKGFTVELFQFSGSAKRWFRFDKDAAEIVFNQVCSMFTK